MASKSNTQFKFPVDLLKCCCCSSLFDEGFRQPRLLPCLHSVCFDCLQSHIKSKTKIECKYGQEETDVIDKTVEQFPMNGTQDGFVKLYKIKNSKHFLQCQECEDELTAEFLCETCPKQLCKDCHEHHKRAKRSHVLFSLQDMPLTFDSAKKLSSERKCQMKGHDGEKLTFYCNSCKEIVCSKCILIAHKEGHTVLELHKTYETEVQKIEKETKTLDVVENKMNNIKELVESEIVNVEETSDTISTEIETAFEKVIETLNCRKQELMNELRHKTKIKTRRLKDQAFHLKKQISIISSTQSSIQLALSTSDSVSLIDAAPFIIEKTLSLRDIQIDKEPCEKPTLAFVETPLGHDSLLGKFISVSISGSRSQVIVPDVGVVGEETEIKVNLFDDDGNVVNDEEMDVCLKISDSHNTVVHTISCYLTENRTWLGKNIFNRDGRYEIVVVVLGVKLEMATTTIDIENAPVMASAQVEVKAQDMNTGLDISRETRSYQRSFPTEGTTKAQNNDFEFSSCLFESYPSSINPEQLVLGYSSKGSRSCQSSDLSEYQRRSYDSSSENVKGLSSYQISNQSDDWNEGVTETGHEAILGIQPRMTVEKGGATSFNLNGNFKVWIYSGNLLDLETFVDVIVSTENCTVSGTGGMAKALLEKAGYKYVTAHKALLVGNKQLPVGSVLITHAGKLQFRNIYHVVIDQFQCNNLPTYNELRKQKLSVTNVLEKANMVPLSKSEKKKKQKKGGVSSIAMALFGSGKLTIPVCIERHCEKVYEAISEFAYMQPLYHTLCLSDIHLVNMNPVITKIMTDVFTKQSQSSASKKPPTDRPVHQGSHDKGKG